MRMHRQILQFCRTTYGLQATARSPPLLRLSVTMSEDDNETFWRKLVTEDVALSISQLCAASSLEEAIVELQHNMEGETEEIFRTFASTRDALYSKADQQAHTHRELGNAMFKRGEIEEAAIAYTQVRFLL